MVPADTGQIVLESRRQTADMTEVCAQRLVRRAPKRERLLTQSQFAPQMREVLSSWSGSGLSRLRLRIHLSCHQSDGRPSSLLDVLERDRLRW